MVPNDVLIIHYAKDLKRAGPSDDLLSAEHQALAAHLHRFSSRLGENRLHETYQLKAQIDQDLIFTIKFINIIQHPIF